MFQSCYSHWIHQILPIKNPGQIVYQPSFFFLYSPWEVDLVIGETSASQNPRRLQVIEVQHCACWGRWRGYPGRSWRLPKSFFFGSTYSYYCILMYIYIHNYIYIYMCVCISTCDLRFNPWLFCHSRGYDLLGQLRKSWRISKIGNDKWRSMADYVTRWTGILTSEKRVRVKFRPKSRNCTDCGSI